MGYLNGPRINFWGGGSTDVDTANNTGHGLVDLVTATVTSNKTDEQLIDALRQPAKNSQGQNFYTVASWNYYGDHQVAFMNAKVSSSGPPGGVSTSGDLVGAPVYLLGSIDPQSGEGPYGGPVMVDLDPTSSQTTRIYVGGLQIGNPNPVLLVRADTLCHSHFLGLRYDRNTTQPLFLTPGSVFANGTFQVGFPKEAIVSYDDTIEILKDIIEAPGAIGIVLRFSMFEFMPGMSSDELQQNYKNNYNDSNRSLGRIIGTIGPWFAGEPASCPPGRLLQNQNLGGAQGLAFLDATNNRLSLDLVSALQGQAIRQDSKANTTPIGANVDYGTLQIGTSAGTLVDTPSLPTSYYVFGGIYDLGLDSGQVTTLSENPIVIKSSKNNLDLAESALRVFSNDRNIYIDEVGGSTTIDLQVMELGGPVQSDTTLTLTTSASGDFPDAHFLEFPSSLTVKAGSDSVVFKVSDNGGDAGFLALHVNAGVEKAYFVNFRKYPQVDYRSIIEAGAIPWETVYEECLRFYYILFPAMSKRIPLNDEATIQAVAGEILKRISDRYRPTTLYMPLTRSLSPDKVALLRAYLSPSRTPA